MLLSVVWTLPFWIWDNRVSIKQSFIDTYFMFQQFFRNAAHLHLLMFALESLSVFHIFFFSFFALRERMILSSFPSAVLLCRGFT